MWLKVIYSFNPCLNALNRLGFDVFFARSYNLSVLFDIYSRNKAKFWTFATTKVLIKFVQKREMTQNKDKEIL